ncbi:MAG: DoxX family protein [Saprospiraceae bacterium]|nr:DoxX family protein [Saprospiraceae bacterium]
MNQINQFLIGGTSGSLAVNLGILWLRLTFGLTMAIHHGWSTISHLNEGAGDYPDPIGLGSGLSMTLMGTTEFLGALLLALGLFSRFACMSLIIGFGVAFFIFHAGDPFGQKEMAFLYLCIFGGLLLTGAGKFSLDHLLFNKDKIS